MPDETYSYLGPAGTFTEAALKEGMRPLRLSAAMHVARGTTTIEEVIGVLPTIE